MFFQKNAPGINTLDESIHSDLKTDVVNKAKEQGRAESDFVSSSNKKTNYYLFISHSEKDSKIVKEFVELLYHIGLNEENIFCSSISEIGVPTTVDIYEYLRNLLDSDHVITVFMLSDNYYSSAACLNEMGAVWLKQTDYYTILLPGFTFEQIKGAINPNKKGIKLDGTNLRDDLTLFKNSITELFQLPIISEQRWEKYRNTFIDFINTKAWEEICFNMEVNRACCINEINTACELEFDKTHNSVAFQFDFSKTPAQMCSFAFFTGEIDLRSAYRRKKQLEFWIKASDNVKKINVEMHLSSMNPVKTIDTSTTWNKINIPICDFAPLESLWHSCKEISFVVNRNLDEAGIVEVRDVKIV